MAAGLVALEPTAAGNLWVVSQRLAVSKGAVECEALHTVFNISICLRGVLRRSGDRLALRLEALDPANGTSFGVETIEEGWGNLATFHTAPLASAAKLLGLELDADTTEALDRSLTNVAPAFAAYLRGSGLLIGADDEATTAAAVELLETATTLDPLYVSAWEVLAAGDCRRFEQAGDPAWLDRGQDAITRAIERWPTVDAYQVLASLRAAGGDVSGRIEALEKATALDPKNAEACQDLARAYKSARRFDVAARALQRAINLRPGY